MPLRPTSPRQPSSAPSPSEVWSRDQLLGELVEQRGELTGERTVGAAEAAVADEGFELEIVGHDGQARGEVILDPREPQKLIVGERGAGLGLLREPALEAFVNRQRIGNEVAVGLKRLAHERDQVRELLSGRAANS